MQLVFSGLPLIHTTPRRSHGYGIASWTLGAWLLSLALFGSATASAAEPNNARYSRDGSRLAWYIQISDTHVDSVIPTWTESVPRLNWVLTDVVSSVQPDFIVVTGDLTDGTDGLIYGGPYDDEWQLYRSTVLDTGISAPDYYFDLPGNHDTYGDEDVTRFQMWSIQGPYNQSTQTGWRIDRPWGSLCFYALATATNNGKPWPADDAQLVAEELAQFEDFTLGNDACLQWVVFGHHDYAGVEGSDGFRSIAAEAGIVRYAHGHNHSYMTTIGGDGILRLRIDSLGHGTKDNVVVHAFDDESYAFEPASSSDPWPMAVVTAPVRGRGEGGDFPASPAVPTTCDSAPIRVLAFDPEGIDGIRCRWDGGDDWIVMEQREDNPHQWRADFSPLGMSAGWHELQLKVNGSQVRTIEQDVRFEDLACDLGEEDEDTGPIILPPEPEPEAQPEALVETHEVIEEVIEEVVDDADLSGDADEDAEAPDDLTPDAGPQEDPAETIESDAPAADLAPEAAGKDAAAGSPDSEASPDSDDTGATPDTTTTSSEGSRSSCALGNKPSPAPLFLLCLVLAATLVRRRDSVRH